MNNISLGLLAHVDAGKTTLAEALLYNSGQLREFGRVDKGSAHLDTYDIEKERGITVYSKEAFFNTDINNYYLIDTPGHSDFHKEMERTLAVLDIAILVISANDSVQSHTKTIWKLLEKHQIPTMIFINKTDMPTIDIQRIKKDIAVKLSENCIDFSDEKNYLEEISLLNEGVLEYYLENKTIKDETIKELINKRKLFPCFYGSALKNTGIEFLLDALDKYSDNSEYTEDFSAKIFRISHDHKKRRLTHMKIYGGKLKVKDSLEVIDYNNETLWKDKVNEIMIYSGESYRNVNEANSGIVCVVTGLKSSEAGQTIGTVKNEISSSSQPLFTYTIDLPPTIDNKQFLPIIREIEEEQPELEVMYDEENLEIRIKVMGRLQLEILHRTISDRYDIDIGFSDGKIIYKETIKNKVEGVGHFEPMKHYAEVHLLIEENPGKGMVFEDNLSSDILDKNWKNLIMSHLHEKQHRGVLSNSLLTDMKITIVNGAAHKKHTTGGDFREATFRALRQGLMNAESILLEPYYDFTLIIPEENIGRAMYDLDKRKATFTQPEQDGDSLVIRGSCAVSLIFDYYQEVLSYTKGEGILNLEFSSYDICHNSEEVIEKIAYNPESDILNPSSSVFSKKGSSFIVSWNQVYNHMHLPLLTEERTTVENNIQNTGRVSNTISNDEIDRIMKKTYYSNSTENEKSVPAYKRNRKVEIIQNYNYNPSVKKDRYLLVDGYNVIFSWPSLKHIAETSLSSARDRLIDIMNNYKGYKNINIIVVFDAYKNERHQEEAYRDGGIDIIYTKTSQTADTYIEKFTHEKKADYDITVITSDRLEGIIARANDALVISSEKFEEEVNFINKMISEHLNK